MNENLTLTLTLTLGTIREEEREMDESARRFLVTLFSIAIVSQSVLPRSGL